MCGIAGFLEAVPLSSAEVLTQVARRMSDTLRHRGPDDGGVWADAGAGIALTMRRLAILDLSPAGHQPMTSPSGRFVIVFNGEIYNCEDLRRDLLAQEPALRFRGHSDTEVMLQAFERWGIADAIVRFNGMFAFAVWDCANRTLTLARDRFGEKPLYYGVSHNTLLFGSELKALRVHPGFSDEMDLGAVALYLRHNCIPAPYSIYRRFRKLPPGTLVTFTAGNFDAKPQTYWSLRQVAESGVLNPYHGNEQDAVENLESLLRDAVKIRMYSDVPLGAFLSGGIDSSTVVALMQSQSGIPVRTFSIGLRESAYDEAPEAARVAKHLGTDHTEFYVTPQEAMAVVPRLPAIYDEPFADSSQIPTFLVAQLARRYVTVSLSGDGGDEMFGGYNRHTWGGPLWQQMKRIPLPLRRAGAAAVTALSPDAWDALYRVASPFLGPKWKQRTVGYKLHKMASMMSSRDAYEMYCRFASHWFEPEKILPGVTEPPSLLTNGDRPRLPSPAEQMMYLDSVTYLPDDILAKVDRATMAVSLEGRIPFLDHRVAEFAWRLPLRFKVRERVGKWVLRQVLYRHVPREMIERPKFGFGIPLDSWLRGPLREWAESLLDESRLRNQGLFDPRPIRRTWKEHLAGRLHGEFHIWDILMFQAWLDEHSGNPAGSPPLAVGEQA